MEGELRLLPARSVVCLWSHRTSLHHQTPSPPPSPGEMHPQKDYPASIFHDAGHSLTIALLTVAKRGWHRAEEGRLAHDLIAETKLEASKALGKFTPMHVAYVPYAVSKIYNASRNPALAAVRLLPGPKLHAVLASAPHPRAAERLLQVYLGDTGGKDAAETLHRAGVRPH